MRSQFVILALALGLALWMLASFMTTDTPNLLTMTVVDRLMFGLFAVAPLLLVSFSAAFAAVSKRTARLHPAATGLLIAGLILGLVWGFGIGLAMG